MKITFLGAAHQVTGSCTLIEWLPGRYLIVDCGMEQGENDYVMEECPVPPGMIEYIILTHAHIDHSGNLPLFYQKGFRGKIYSTPETENLCSIMLADSAHIQETDAQYQTKKNLRTGLPEVKPLYTSEDAANVMKLFRPCEYGETVQIDEGISIRLTDAGHLLGSSFVELFLNENGKKVKLVCSGDVGNLNQPIIRDPELIRDADYLLIESTYGTRCHETNMDPIPVLTEILFRTFSRGGSVIIPSFAVGRTQELLYFFREIKQNNLIPDFQDFPVYVDSPLANEATAIFLQCNTKCLDEDALNVMRSGKNPIWFDGLHTIISSEESKALNTDSSPKVIIASGGMCEGGRIRHHLKHNLWNKNNTIMFAGYQAAGTLGRIIYDGAPEVKIFGETIEVNAEITLLKGISGHADQAGLISWINRFDQKPGMIFVNHGDDDSCSGLASLIREKFNIEAWAPYSGSEYDLLHHEWIRLTDPVLRIKAKQKRTEAGTAGNQNEELHRLLMVSVNRLKEAAGNLKGHSNSEIRKLTSDIEKLLLTIQS